MCRLGENFLTLLQHRSGAAGPNQKHAFKDALTQTGSPIPESTLSALRRRVLANSFKASAPTFAVASPPLLLSLSTQLV
jgi:hypothetical protein